MITKALNVAKVVRDDDLLVSELPAAAAAAAGLPVAARSHSASYASTHTLLQSTEEYMKGDGGGA